jgi:hypothetical protein
MASEYWPLHWNQLSDGSAVLESSFIDSHNQGPPIGPWFYKSLWVFGEGWPL